LATVPLRHWITHVRAFLALTLPEKVRQFLAALQAKLSRAQADVQWVEPPNLHVTLKFLGEITDEQRRAVEQLLGAVARGETAFTLRLDRVGAFPSLSSPRVVWVGLGEGKERAIRLAARLEQDCGGLGLRKEERPFAAHVTLGRVRTPRGRSGLVRALTEFGWQAPAPWDVTALALYQSTLSSRGPIYSVLAEVPLKSG
jgi:2'-5' RNA ligase